MVPNQIPINTTIRGLAAWLQAAIDTKIPIDVIAIDKAERIMAVICAWLTGLVSCCSESLTRHFSG